MDELEVLRDILVIFSVSIGVVFLFQKLHLPSIAGFLVAGTLVGPYGLNLISGSSDLGEGKFHPDRKQEKNNPNFR